MVGDGTALRGTLEVLPDTSRDPHHPEQLLTVGFAARKVRLLHREEPLWLVVVRLGKGTKRRRGSSEPWRLLTNEPVRTVEECWRIVEAYAARRRVEQMLRFGKSELGVESVRVRGWEPRPELLAMVSLAYALLLELEGDGSNPILPAILHWAHRTGRQTKGAWCHLYRLRAAIAEIWRRHPGLPGNSPKSGVCRGSRRREPKSIG